MKLEALTYRARSTYKRGIPFLPFISSSETSPSLQTSTKRRHTYTHTHTSPSLTTTHNAASVQGEPSSSLQLLAVHSANLHYPLQLTTLAAFMATASALAFTRDERAATLDERATTPTTLVVSYDVIECTKSNAGGVVNPKKTLVAQNNCTALPLTLSFESLIQNACPAKTMPELTVYSLAGCSGSGVVDRGFSPTDPTCVEAQVGGAKSAFFKCNIP